MKETHLSAWDQEEYVLGQRTPEMVRHLSQCAACFGEVEKMERGLAIFRESATTWSAEQLEAHPPVRRIHAGTPVAHRSMMPVWGWALAALVLMAIMLQFGYRQSHHTDLQSAHVGTPIKAISDDALLQQVDEEVSIDVPSSMEPLTHLVTTSGAVANDPARRGGKRRVERD